MSNPEIFFQTLAILDHPADPMVMHFQICFTDQFKARGFGLEDFKAATRRLFEKHARLREALRCEARAFENVAAGRDQAVAFNEQAWSADAMSLDEFRQQALAFDQAPLLRFRLSEAEGLSVACHHSLMDGYGCFELSTALLSELYPLQEELPSVAALPPVPGWIRFLGGLNEYRIMLRDHFRQMGEISRNPTSLLARPNPPLKQRHFFLTGEIPLSEIQAVRAKLREKGQEITLNDLVLAAFSLALGDLLSKKGAAGRLSITVPFNMRARKALDPMFTNRTGYVSVSTLPEHRLDRSQTLARIHTEMARAKRYRTGRTVEIILSFYERLGLLKFARKAWLKNKTPARYEGPEAFFWKSFDTAIVTNPGRIQWPEPHASWISAVYGFAPLISPAASLAVMGLGDQVCLGLRFGSSTLSRAEGEALLAAFFWEIRAF